MAIALLLRTLWSIYLYLLEHGCRADWGSAVNRERKLLYEEKYCDSYKFIVYSVFADSRNTARVSYAPRYVRR